MKKGKCPFAVASVWSVIKQSARVSMAATFAAGLQVTALKYHVLCFVNTVACTVVLFFFKHKTPNCGFSQSPAVMPLIYPKSRSNTFPTSGFWLLGLHYLDRMHKVICTSACEHCEKLTVLLEFPIMLNVSEKGCPSYIRCPSYFICGSKFLKTIYSYSTKY